MPRSNARTPRRTRGVRRKAKLLATRMSAAGEGGNRKRKG